MAFLNFLLGTLATDGEARLFEARGYMCACESICVSLYAYSSVICITLKCAQWIDCAMTGSQERALRPFLNTHSLSTPFSSFLRRCAQVKTSWSAGSHCQWFGRLAELRLRNRTLRLALLCKMVQE